MPRARPAAPRTLIRCAIYTRQSVSSNDDLSSCEVQRERCVAFVCSRWALGWTLIAERFDDDGFSGATLKRPALQRLLALVRAGEVDMVVVHRLDRLARSVLVCANLLHEFRDRRVGLVIVTAPELGFAAQDSFMLNILASFAEFEREMIATRIAESRVRLKARGRRIAGAAPFGYEADVRTKQLVLSPIEASVARWMFERAAAGDMPAAIAKAANARGLRTKMKAGGRGGSLWTARQVLAILRNAVYVGIFNDNGGVRIGHHEPIVTKETFDAVAALLLSRRTRTPGKRYDIDWPLKGRIVCGICERGMTPHTIRRRNVLYRYYRCRSTAGGSEPCGHQVSAEAIEQAVVKNVVPYSGPGSKEHMNWDLVELVVYDHRDRNIRARVLRPAEPDQNADSAQNPRIGPASETRTAGSTETRESRRRQSDSNRSFGT